MLQNLTYFDVLKKAYYDDDFWHMLIAKPAHALDKYGISLNVDDEEKLFSALKDFSLVLAFDRYRRPKLKIPPTDNITGWDCKVPWGQT
ncbi:MAG: hypothetical protein NTX65_11565 [Ignavibacteriales bacterium]|nr:hypothetical protein [Ignavibacteriales bacterium]